MNDAELLAALDRIKGIMIAVATGGPRIKEVQAEFTQLYNDVATELTSRRLPNPLPYRDLWEWYGRWSGGELPSWQSRRVFVNDIFRGLVQTISNGPTTPAPAPPVDPAPIEMSNQPQWDVFVSHAREDKDDFARPLAERLRALGLRVWFDEFTLVVGDSLLRSIDRGLANSRFGVVIISPHFLKKQWPQLELDGLVAREAAGVKVILPVWHQIRVEEVRSYSPILAGRLAATSSDGIEHVANELLRAIERDQPWRQNVTPTNVESKTDLVAFGPEIVCVGDIVAIEQAEWTLQVSDFVTADVGAFIRFVENFQSAKSSQRYVIVNAIGDGRMLSAPPSLEKVSGRFSVRCPVCASTARVAAQDLPSDVAISPNTNDLYVENGQIARISGIKSLPQHLRQTLSHMKGEGFFHRDFGSRLQEYYWRFRSSPWLEAMLKLEITRLAAIPYNDEVSNLQYTPLRCVDRVWSVKLLAPEPDRRRIPMLLDLEIRGLGRVENEISVLMPPIEIVERYITRSV
jgi:hypothetical protein